ncbi:hypothetical protein GWI33_017958 [Rhynchophorus ferrugineus]|uniref:Uncharacterized protein n=1 Tax=Rhynchophorus ferrugineus TaxID=354439 RepID=A0A834HVR4_RHYFE|nr:hypothetical protein GWI33_017958 [Rhynchophorus ferrugineus]
MINWDSIKEFLRLEEHNRIIKDTAQSTNPLRHLTEIQFKMLQLNYEKYTPYIRGLFILITLFQILWDVMLNVATKEPVVTTHRRRTGSIVNGNTSIPTFMGRPIYPQSSQGDDESGIR